MKARPPGLTRLQAEILTALEEPRTVEEITAMSGSHPVYVRTIVKQLEFDGLVRRLAPVPARWEVSR